MFYPRDGHSKEREGYRGEERRRRKSENKGPRLLERGETTRDPPFVHVRRGSKKMETRKKNGKESS